jgi:hypothetical protein
LAVPGDAGWKSHDMVMMGQYDLTKALASVGSSTYKKGRESEERTSDTTPSYITQSNCQLTF